jgi:hypothetical protein
MRSTVVRAKSLFTVREKRGMGEREDMKKDGWGRVRGEIIQKARKCARQNDSRLDRGSLQHRWYG